MNPSIIRFHHFTSERNYCKLQEIFGRFDYKNDYNSIVKPLNDFEIIYYNYDEFTNEDHYKTLFFRKDFLIPGIRKLKEYYFESFNKAIYEKGLFTEDLLVGFSKYYKNKLFETSEIIFDANYIETKIRVILRVVIDNLINEIDEFIATPYYYVKEKLQFNWNRTDVEVFFHLLRENKVIAWIGDADLGRIIDNVIECSSGESYLPINGSRKHLNDFKNTSERPQLKSIERLTAVFQNKDFFNK